MKMKPILLSFVKSYIRTIATTILFVAIIITATSMQTFAFNTDVFAKNSVLSSGNWVKIKVSETGIQRITQADASKWGFSDISKVRIFGYGGQPISEVLASNTYIDDLPQIPVSRVGNSILFYGKNHESWGSNGVKGTQKIQIQHPYAEAGYYFITDNDVPDLLIESAETPNINSQEITSFTERIHHEKELFSPGQTGRYLLGEDFKYKSSQSFKFDLDGYVEGSDVSVLTSFGAKIVNGTGNLRFTQNGTNIASSPDDKIKMATDVNYVHSVNPEILKRFPITGKSLTFSIELTYSGTLYMARLNYISINYTRALNLTNKILSFRGETDHSNLISYSISGATAESMLWDLTDSNKPFQVKYKYNDNNAKFSPLSGGREYIIFEPTAKFASPTMVEKVANQDIHSVEVPDMVIISPAKFLSEAERVANLHRTNDKMTVYVVEPELIYNEFSSGTPDAMAYRKMLKMFYDRGTTANGSKLKYLLLFGGGSYDNRQITDKVKKNSYPMLLTWQSVSGLTETDSYTSDDFFAFMGDDSGRSISLDKINIAVGRMLFKDLNEAKTVVDKLYKYVTNKDFGSWKNHVLMIADDEDNATHMAQSELSIASMKANGGSHYSFDHVYIDAFEAVGAGTGRTYPSARTKMFQRLKEGALWVSYIGHANPVSWTAHRLLTITDVNENLFYKHLPLVYTATCEFTRWDSDEFGGGELMFLNRQGGAIGVISASRVVFISNNGVLSDYLSRQVFKKDENGKHQTIGDILKNAKNTYLTATSRPISDDNKLRYQLIGDPAMKLAYPSHNIKLETVNGQPVDDQNQPILKSRDNVVITGSVYDELGNKDTNFKGNILSTLYDAEKSVETFGHTSDSKKPGTKYVYQDRLNRLYIGQDLINNGEFNIKFNMPTEIDNNYSPAMFSFYAYEEGGKEANGASENLYVYGYNEEVIPDTEGPIIESLYLNVPSFKNGDNVNESPMVCAKFSDVSGINVSSSGIGHQISILVDGEDLHSNVVQYYTPNVEGNGGSINFPLSNLTKGNHKLRFKVWDIFNNSSEKEINFFVTPGLAPQISEVYTLTNPASVSAEFYLKHNRPDAQIAVTISVYDIAGREVWSTTEKGTSDDITSFPITWNLNDNGGKRVGRGIYVYRATITTDGIQEATASKKLAVTAE